jgi:hypothetical protein
MTSESDSPKEKSFQVVDKRRFDTAGHERTEESATAQPKAEQQQTAQPKAPQQQAEPTQAAGTVDSSSFTLSDTQRDDEAEPVAFTSFIMSLATQVLVQLGEMPAPEGMEIPIDLDAARQTIDIITMIQRRTKGNVSTEEARFLDEVLHSLRVSFVNAKKKSV